MRFYCEQPKLGALKTRRRFLLLPRTINKQRQTVFNGLVAVRETRWLEVAALVYQYKRVKCPTKFGTTVEIDRWVLIGFQDDVH